LLTTINHANVVALVARAVIGGKTQVYVRESNTIVDVLAVEKNWKARLIPWCMRQLYRRAAGVIAISADVRNRLESVVGDLQRLAVIHNPVITPEMTGLADAVSVVSIPPGRFLLAVGRLVPQKNFHLLLRAFARVRLSQPDLSLVILGEGPQRSELQALVGALGLEGHVVLTGFVHNPFPIFRRANLYCLSSSWEGFGNVIIEAMFYGVPVVSTACPGGPQELIVAGENGLLSPVDDEAAFAENILRGLGHSWDRAGIHAFAARFNLAEIATSYLRFMGLSS
jgi:glycosyltransferase involved in cell wall biosynthesis